MSISSTVRVGVKIRALFLFISMHRDDRLSQMRAQIRLYDEKIIRLNTSSRLTMNQNWGSYLEEVVESSWRDTTDKNWQFYPKKYTLPPPPKKKKNFFLVGGGGGKKY